MILIENLVLYPILDISKLNISDLTTLLKLYWSLVQSKVDNGSIIYGTAVKSYVQMLDPIHNQGLRLAL